MNVNFPQFSIQTLNLSIADLIGDHLPDITVYDNPSQSNADRPCIYINYYNPNKNQHQIDNMYNKTLYIDLIYESKYFDDTNQYDDYVRVAEVLENVIENLTYNVRDNQNVIINRLHIKAHDVEWSYDPSVMHFKFQLKLRLKKETEEVDKIEKIYYNYHSK